MPTVYATLADLRAFYGVAPGDPLPVDDATATRYLRLASGLVALDIRGALYNTNPAGAPTDPEVIDPTRDATLTQAAAWIDSGIDPSRGSAQLRGAIKSKALSGGGASVTYDTPDPRLVVLAEARRLTDDAWLILYQAGLITTAISDGSAGDVRIVAGMGYRVGEAYP